MEIQVAEKWVKNYESLLSGLELNHEHKRVVPLTLLQLSLEHNAAIIKLIKGRMHASAFALLRPQRDAFLRGIWLYRCATEQQLQKFMSGKEPPNTKTLLNQIEQTDGYRHGELSVLFAQNKDYLHDFTHGGLYQAASRDKGDRIAGGHSREQLLWVLNHTSTLSFLASLEICHVFGDVGKSHQLTSVFSSVISVPL